jgi:rhomboid family GlyGly-CTERM serine protease
MTTSSITGTYHLISHKAVRRMPCASLLLTLVAMIIHLTNSLRAGLLYERNAMANLELWRVVTCHWVHLNWDHLFWSGITFLLLGSVCEILDRKKTFQTLTISAIFVPIAVWLGLPGLNIYAGLSGLDCAFYALLFTLLFKQEQRAGDRKWAAFYALGLAALLAKVLYETATGQTIFVANNHDGMVPVPLSHLTGGLVGFMVGIRGKK